MDECFADIATSFRDLRLAQEEEAERVDDFVVACREAHESGISDQTIANLTARLDPTGRGYSRARIQQFRNKKD